MVEIDAPQTAGHDTANERFLAWQQGETATSSDPDVSTSAQPEPLSRRSALRWILLGAILIPCLYLPTLATRFDFTDDGNLVYPSPPMPPGQRLALVWDKIVANYEHLGPFRPVLWAHWEAQAELFGGHPFAWRAGRLAWSMFAAGMLLWLLRELRFRPGVALLVTALALWNPYRGEIWTSLTLSEGVAMPYALLALVCAVRAARSPRPLAWDVPGILCVLACLFCKNTFAALVPAQMLLRLAPDGEPLLSAWRTRGRRACLLALTLLVPAGHFLLFKLTWHEGQYIFGATPMTQLRSMVGAIGGGMGIDFVGPGLLLGLFFLIVAGLRRKSARLFTVWLHHRGACRAGLALLLGGIVVYLPIIGISGRYTIPAVWGADLLLAALVSEVCLLPQALPRRLTLAALVLGTCAVAVACLGRQDRFAAKVDVLWQGLEHVERDSPPGTCLAWMEGPHLSREEGIHFAWHLHARGRTDLTVRLFDVDGRPIERCEMTTANVEPTLVVTCDRNPPSPAHALCDFTARSLLGTNRYHLLLRTVPSRPREIANVHP